MEALHQLIEQKCCRIGTQSDLTRVFQPTVFGTQTQQQVETHTKPEQFECLSQGRKIQDGDTGNHPDIPPARGVGHLLPYPDTGTIQKISEIFHQFKALPFGLSTAPLEFTVIAKEVKLMAMHKGIRNKLKEGSKVKSDHINRFTAHDFLSVYHPKPLGPIISEL